MAAKRCEACGRMQYSVERLALLVEGQVRVERDLCAACRTEAIDALIELRPMWSMAR